MLKEYRKARKIKQIDLAKQLGVSNVYLCQIEGGTRSPGLALAVRIERITNGEIPANSWVPEDAA